MSSHALMFSYPTPTPTPSPSSVPPREPSILELARADVRATPGLLGRFVQEWAVPSPPLSPLPVRNTRSKGADSINKAPPNAFLLFRSALIRSGVVGSQCDISRVAGERWKALSGEEKQPWKDMYRLRCEEHEAAHPKQPASRERKKSKGIVKRSKATLVVGQHQKRVDPIRAAALLQRPRHRMTAKKIGGHHSESFQGMPSLAPMAVVDGVYPSMESAMSFLRQCPTPISRGSSAIGTTVSGLVADLPMDSSLRRYIAGPSSWPAYGDFTTSAVDPRRGHNTQPTPQVPGYGARYPQATQPRHPSNLSHPPAYNMAGSQEDLYLPGSATTGLAESEQDFNDFMAPHVSVAETSRTLQEFMAQVPDPLPEISHVRSGL